MNRRWPYLAAAVAATLLVVLGFGLVRWRTITPAERAPGSQIASEITPTPISAPPVRLVMLSPTIQMKRNLAAARSNRHRRESLPSISKVVSGREEREIATDFIPLVNDAAGFEPGSQIVRVELPRSMMTGFGLPVNMDRADRRVKADVLLGMDGLARAIRFVQ